MRLLLFLLGALPPTPLSSFASFKRTAIVTECFLDGYDEVKKISHCGDKVCISKFMPFCFLSFVFICSTFVVLTCTFVRLEVYNSDELFGFYYLLRVLSFLFKSPWDRAL